MRDMEESALDAKDKSTAVLSRSVYVKVGLLCLLVALAGVVAYWKYGMSRPNDGGNESNAHTQMSIVGDWTGRLNAGFQSLDVAFHVEEAKCTLDVPGQGAFGVVGTVLSASPDAVEMTFKTIGGKFKGKLKKGNLVGVWCQGLGIVPLSLTAGKLEMPRPQEPKPPFPYRTENVVFANADASLSGTLTLPNVCNEKTPALLMVTGSGPQNRDEEMFYHRPCAVMADFLARRGIVTLRYDDRGVGESKGNTKNISIEDIMLDAESGVECLRKRFAHVGVLGHSEGGTVSFMLAQKGKVDFVVSLAGPALKFGDVLDEQLRKRLKSEGKSENAIANELPALKQSFIKDDGIRRYFDYDPLDAVKATHCPVLALNGEKDAQVTCERHLSVLRENLVPKERMTVKSYPGLNHLFQHCKTGEFTEYAKIEETISPEVLSDIASFVKSVCGD